MGAAAAIRLQVESSLARRVPAALTLKIKQAPEVFSTGMASVDAMLGGGIPRSSITEVSGEASTGKTSFALSTLAKVTQLGNACAWVDVNDALSPESAAAAGVDLRRLLWLRMSAERRQKDDKPWSRLDQALRSTDLLLQTGGFAAIVLDLSEVLPQHTMRVPKDSRGLVVIDCSDLFMLTDFSIDAALYGDLMVHFEPVGPGEPVGPPIPYRNARGLFAKTSRVSAVLFHRRFVEEGTVRENWKVYPTNRANADTIRLSAVELGRFGQLGDRANLAAEEAPGNTA